MNENPDRLSLTVENRLHIEQLIAEMVDWITDVHNRGDEVMPGFNEFVTRSCHEDFVYQILETNKEPAVYDRAGFLGFFHKSSEHVLSVERMPGILRVVSCEHDEATDTDKVVIRNRVWALLLLASNPDARQGNLANQEWHFQRTGRRAGTPSPWQFRLWKDWPLYVSLSG